MLVGLTALPWDAMGQLSLSTTNFAGNGSNGTTFEVTAIRSVRLHRMWQQYFTAATSTPVEIWARPGGMGTPPSITTANGWVQLVSTTIPATTGMPEEIPNDLNLLLPAGTTYGFYIGASTGTTVAYSTGGLSTSPPSTYTDGNITINAAGYGGAIPNPGFNPRIWNGRVDYFLANSFNDAAVVSIDSVSAACPGNQNIWTTIGNYGNNQIDSVTVNWSWNGTLQAPIQLTTLLDTFGGMGSTTAPVFLGTQNFAAGQFYNLKVWTSNPNGVADTSNLNDTLEVVVGASLQGTFTINSGAATGGSNFTSFGDAVSALNQFGVCGPVIFNVTAGSGPYKEQVSIGQIVGASSVNTITFDGGATNEEIWTDESMTSTSDRHVIRLDGADWIRLQNLTIVARAAQTNSNGFGVGIHLTNEADNNIIQGCIINTDSGRVTGSSNFGAIQMSGQFWSTNNASGSNNIIRNNHTYGGYFGVSLAGGGSTSFETNNVIEDNIFEELYAYGIRSYYQEGAQIKGNHVHIRTQGSVVATFGYPVYVFYNDTIRIEGNTLLNPKTYGIYMSSGNRSSSSTSPSGFANVINNCISGEIGTTSPRCIYVASNTTNTNFYHNSVSVTSGTSTTMAAMYVGTSTTNSGLDVRNNSFAVFNTSAGYALYGGTANFSHLDYNNYYNDGDTSKILFLNGVVGLGTLNTAGGFNAASHHGDPQYLDNYTNLHSKGTQLWDRGNNAVGIAEDIDGDARPGFGGLIVDIGCDEFFPPQLDATPTLIASPGLPLCPGTFTFTIDVKNLGMMTIDTLTIDWWVNGVAQTSTTTTGMGLASGANTAITAGALTVAAGTPYDLMFVTSSPNNGVDEDMSNDTLRFTGLQTGFAAGTYTIDSGSPTGGTNYNSFGDAIAAMAANGICGAVVFNVVAGSGPYKEQVSIPEITGASSTATITFDGGATKEEIWADATMTNTGNRHVIRLDGADWVILKNLTINNHSLDPSNQFGTYGYGIHMQNEADHNIIEDCSIEVDTALAASSSNFGGIIMAGQFGTSTNAAGSHNTIRNNYIHGGYYGITMMSANFSNYEENNVVEGNTLEEQYYYNIYSYGQSGFVAKDNYLHHRINGILNSTFGYSIYMFYQDTARVEKNMIINPLAYGIYMSRGNSAPGNQAPSGDAYVVNNMVGGEYRATTIRAIYIASNTVDVNVWHNSVSVTRGGSSTSAAMYVGTTSTNSNIDVRNNSFAVFGSSSGYAFYGGTSNFSDLNYNNYYNNGDTSKIIFLSGAVGLGALTTTGGFNSASHHGDPLYIDNFSNLHTKATQLWDRGNNAVGVSEDIDGDTRPGFGGLIVDIGADEFQPPQLDASPTGLNPGLPICAGSFNVAIDVLGLGQSTIDTLTVNWWLNGTAQTPVTVTGLGLASGTSTTISLGSTTIMAGTPYDLMFVTSMPNNSVDEDMSNDTLRYTGLQSGLPGGTYTINSGAATSGTNYASFGEAIADLNTFGVCGPVVFNVVAGSGPYHEQVEMGEIQGTSSINTVTFNGGATKEEIWADTAFTSTTNRHVIRLNGADWVRLQNLTISNHSLDPTNQFGTYGVGIHMQNEADNNIIEGCFIEVDTALAASSGNFCGIQRAGQFGTSTNPAGSHNIIRNNTIHGGYYGITNMGSGSGDYEENNVVEGNQLLEQYYYNIYSYAQSGFVARDNYCLHRTNGILNSTFGYGIYLVYQDTMRIEGNTVQDPLGYGIYMTIGNRAPGLAPPSGDGFVTNNSVFGIYRTTTVRAIYVAGNTSDVNFWHNSVSATSGGSTTMAAMYVSTTSSNSGLDIRNNSFAVFNTNSGYAFYGGINNIDTLDYNNYYNNGDTSRVLFLSGVVPLSNLNTAGGQNANSQHGDPSYVDNFLDVHGAGTQLWDVGDNAVGITTDIDGDMRPGFGGTVVDIGSDEFDVPGDDVAAVQVIEPMAGCGDSLTPVSIVIRNFGTNSQTNFPISVVIDTNGVVLTTLTISYTGTLGVRGQDTVLIGYFNSGFGGNFGVTAFTNLTNDQKSTNDSVKVFSITLREIPAAPNVAGTTLCGPDSTVLRVASPDTAVTYTWYDDIYGNNLIQQGPDTLQTPFLNVSDTFYVGQFQPGGGLMVTEAELGGPDYVEIQNTSNQPINVTGWSVWLGEDGRPSINSFLSTPWNLSGTINPGQVLFREDASGANYWGTNILWNPSQEGWVLILDNNNDVVDFVVWGHNATAVASFGPTINGTTISVANHWSGAGVNIANSNLYRTGNIDNNDASDWQQGAANFGGKGTLNPGLQSLFSGCESNLRMVPVIIAPPVTIDLGPDRAACGAVTLDPGVFSAYSWNTSDTTQTIDATVTGTYSVIVTNSGGCLGTDTVNLFINPNPVVDIGNDTTVCGSILLDAGNPGADRTWQDGTTKTQTYLAATTGQYSVTVIDLNTGCQTIDSAFVTVNPLPPVDLGLDRAECDSVVLDANNPGLDILWSPGNQTSQTITVTTSGQYSVTATDQGSGCAGIDTVNLTIAISPVVDLGPPDTQACDLVILDAGNPGLLYDWCNGDLGQTIIITKANEGQHCVTVTDVNGCSGTDTINVDIVDNPVAAYTADTTQLTVDFTNMSTGGGLTYQWSFGDGGTSTLQDPSHTYANTGVYTVQLIITNACGSDTITTTVTAIATGLDAKFFDGKLAMFPNPTNDIVNFRTEGLDLDLKIAIYDVRGRLVTQQVVRRFDQDRLTKVDLSDQAKGVYTVYFEAGDHKLVQKLVLK